MKSPSLNAQGAQCPSLGIQIMFEAGWCKFLSDPFIHSHKCTHCCSWAVIWESSFQTEQGSVNCADILQFPEHLDMQLLLISLIHLSPA